MPVKSVDLIIRGGRVVTPTEVLETAVAVSDGKIVALGAELVLIGYNTPLSPLALDLNELCLRAGAYQNNLFVVGIAKAGIEDGMELIGGSCIVNPMGQVVAKAATTGDELVAARIDLDQMIPARKRWDFLGRRHPEHYGLLTQPTRPGAR